MEESCNLARCYAARRLVDGGVIGSKRFVREVVNDLEGGCLSE